MSLVSETRDMLMKLSTCRRYLRHVVRFVDEYSCEARDHIHSFIHSFTAIRKAHYVENVESEALEAVARWSVIGKIVSF